MRARPNRPQCGYCPSVRPSHTIF